MATDDKGRVIRVGERGGVYVIGDSGQRLRPAMGSRSRASLPPGVLRLISEALPNSNAGAFALASRNTDIGVRTARVAALSAAFVKAIKAAVRVQRRYASAARALPHGQRPNVRSEKLRFVAGGEKYVVVVGLGPGDFSAQAFPPGWRDRLWGIRVMGSGLVGEVLSSAPRQEREAARRAFDSVGMVHGLF